MEASNRQVRENRLAREPCSRRLRVSTRLIDKPMGVSQRADENDIAPHGASIYLNATLFRIPTALPAKSKLERMPSTEPDRVNDRTIKHDYRFYTILGISKHMTIGVDSSNRIERARNVAERIWLHTAISIVFQKRCCGDCSAESYEHAAPWA